MAHIERALLVAQHCYYDIEWNNNYSYESFEAFASKINAYMTAVKRWVKEIMIHLNWKQFVIENAWLK